MKKIISTFQKRVVNNTTISTSGINGFLLILLLMAVFLLGILSNQVFSSGKIKKTTIKTAKNEGPDLEKITKKVLPGTYIIKIAWGDLGKRLVEDGVLDKTKLAQALTGKEEIPQDVAKYLEGGQKEIEINLNNSRFWLDVLWGLGLANKNKILDEGPMQTASNNQPESFASTGGYTIGPQDPMSVYSKFDYIKLNDKQQKVADEVADGIYRPCCGNSTSFPDCNHGMAMLALVELMASQNYSKETIFKTALVVNSYWFPQTYLDIAYYLEKNGRDFSKLSPSQLLSKSFSSSQGYAVIREKVGFIQWPGQQGGGSCGA